MKIRYLLTLLLIFSSSSVMATIVNFQLTTTDPIDWVLSGDNLDPSLSDTLAGGTEDYIWDLDEGDYLLTVSDDVFTSFDYSLDVPSAEYELVVVSEFLNLTRTRNGTETKTDISFSINKVPEPSILFLMGFGLVSLSLFGRRKKS